MEETDCGKHSRSTKSGVNFSGNKEEAGSQIRHLPLIISATFVLSPRLAEHLIHYGIDTVPIGCQHCRAAAGGKGRYHITGDGAVVHAADRSAQQRDAQARPMINGNIGFNRLHSHLDNRWKPIP